MKKQSLKILLGVLFTVFSCWACRTLTNFIDPLGLEGRSDSVIIRDEYYEMDLQTILQDAVKNRPVKLNPVSEPDEILPSVPPLVPWTQADYLRVANAVFLTVWGELPASWNLDEIYAETNCAGIGVGFQTMSFNFFKVEKRNVYFYMKRRIYINPEKNLLWVFEVKTFPVRSWGWDTIDADKIVPAENALKIAEENGGFQAREGIKECDVTVEIIAGDNWQVSYKSDHNFFFMEIDEKTGQIVR